MREFTPLTQIDRVRIGDMFFQTEEYGKAASFYLPALGTPPENAYHALTKYALCSLRSGDMASCDWALGEAFQLNPEDAYYWNVSALAGHERGKFEGALEKFQQAIRFQPNEPEFYLNMAYCQQVMGDFVGAEAAYSKVVALNPADLRARFYRALTILTQGRFIEGFPEYEMRYAVYPDLVPRIGKPIWRGRENIAGKTILLCAEQGAGDGVQFARYAIWLKAHCGVERVLILCRPEMVNILRCVAGVNAVVTSPESAEFDFLAPLMSMPGLSMEQGEPWWGPTKARYLDIPAGKRQEFQHKKNIGFCWAGNPQHGNDRFRSIKPELFKAFANLDPARFGAVNLQHEGQEDCGMLSPRPKTLLGLAQLIDQLDLVITVDTAVAHLAGALGKPVWALVASNPDWRWGLGSEGSLWYPTMRLFRQEEPLEWKPVIERVCGELGRQLSEWSAA